MLHLILPDRNQVRVVQDDVGSHQDRIVEQTGIGGQSARFFLLERMTPFQESHRRDGQKEPGQLRHLGNFRLNEKGGALRIKSQSQQVERGVSDILPQTLRIADRCQRVEIGDEIEGIIRIPLHVDILPNRSEIVTPMKPAGGLYPRKNPHVNSIDILCDRRIGIESLRAGPFSRTLIPEF